MIRQRTLDNGVRLVTERVEGVRSCAIGLHLNAGSRREREDEAGLGHFAEHMMFKGTPTYDALALNDRLNELGGNFNAFTGQETICLHGRTVEHKAAASLDLLLEMLIESTFPEAEVRRERNVILEEYKLYEDTPDDIVVDIFYRNLWPSHPLGRAVIGTGKSIRAFSGTRLREFWQREFQPGRLVVSIAGQFDAAECSRVLLRRLAHFNPGRKARPAGNGRASAADSPGLQSYKARPVEQVQFCFGAPGPHRTHPDRFAFTLLNMIYGGGMSSRLFQEIREKRGLAYSIGSFTQPYSDMGSWAVSGGTSPATIDDVVRLSLEEAAKLCAIPVALRELDLAREQIVDGLLLGLENTGTRMMRNAESLISTGRPVPPDEIIARLRAVTPAEVLRVARRWFAPPKLAAGFVGPKGGAVPKSLRAASC